MAAIELTRNGSGNVEFPDFARESNHRISNHLALVASMVRMQASSISRGPEMLSRIAVRSLLHETAGKIAGVAHLHRKLAEEHHTDRIELGEFLIECCTILVNSLALAGRVGFVQRLDRDCYVSAHQAQSIGLIVNEVIMNAIKHAHPTGIPVEIKLACRREARDCIEIEIEDDGVGLPKNFDRTSGGGMGFTLIRSLANTLNAALSVESESLGTSFRITVPVRQHSC